MRHVFSVKLLKHKPKRKLSKDNQINNIISNNISKYAGFCTSIILISRRDKKHENST